jgi:16S rRNA (cytosine1402-N4)-methyltransferase
MRFGGKGESAEDILNAYSADELADIFRKYGEEPFAKAIARRIVGVRRATPLETTYDLANVVVSVVPQRFLNKALARIFQAVRIAVNRELDILEYTLNNISGVLRSGGRIVVISYHSLEDRIVKNIFRTKSRPQKFDDIYGKAIDVPELKIITKKPIVPDDEELERNPRARSAKLRVAEKI